MEQVDQNHLTIAEVELAQRGLLEPQRGQHLSACEQCAAILEAHGFLTERLASAAPSGEFSEDCLSPEELVWIATGVSTPLDSERAMSHVASCERCAALLDSMARSDSSEVEVLKSTSEEAWVKPMAAKLAQAMAPKRIRRPFWMPFAAAAAIILALVAGSVIWMRYPFTTPERLLAKAYTESRSFDFRLPNNGYSPVRQQRSGGRSPLERSPSLVQAEVEIQRALQSRPDAANILLLRGRAELLEEQFDAAISSLSRALEADPHNPTILTDLGCAYALRGDVERRSVDYTRTIDLLRQSLQLQTSQPDTVFNLALVYERAGLLEESVATWQQFLVIEPTGEWADEARRRLSSVQERLKARQAIRDRVTSDPEAFLAQFDSQATPAELFLDIAWRDWLPKRGEKATAAALAALGQLLAVQHNDSSLGDAAATPTSVEGLDTLSRAIALNLAGSFDQARNLAQRAEILLQSNSAARLRARLESSYAAQRSSFQDCLSVVVPLNRALADSGYTWMQGQGMLQEGICDARGGDLNTARILFVRAHTLLTRSNWKILSLRALGAIGNLQRTTGDFVEASNIVCGPTNRLGSSCSPSTRSAIRL